MEELMGKIREAWIVFMSMALYKLLLDFIIGFLIVAVVLQLLGANLIIAVIPAGLYMLLQLIREARRVNIVKRLESRYGGLRERLSTAYDNRSRDNIIVQSLLSDVSARMDDVESSSFVEPKALTSRTIASVVLTFLLLTVTVLNLRGLALGIINENTGLQNTIDDVKDKYSSEMQALMGERWEASNWTTDDEEEKLGAESGGKRPGYGQGPVPGTGFGTGSESGKDILGKASSASIEGKDIDFQLHPEYGGNIEIQESGGRVKPEDFKLTSVQSADTCDDCAVGPEHEEIVRKYFEKISEGV